MPIQLSAAQPTQPDPAVQVAKVQASRFQPTNVQVRNRNGAPIRLPNVRRAKANRVKHVIKPVSALGKLPKPVARRQAEPTADSFTGWLPSGTSAATTNVATKLLDQANQEFRVGAWLSAETSAWEAMRLASEAIDQRQREIGRQQNSNTVARATSNLQIAKQAIFEARDFAKIVESPSPESIARIARSHQTEVLRDNRVPGMSATDASDRYLDFARTRLATIASQSVQAAQAMDLLAAIYLRRSDSRTLPGPTALCLRRAAIQGQPGNASLAANLGVQLTHVGLHREAQWALEHSMSMDPNPKAAEALAALHRKSGRHDQASNVIASVPALNNPGNSAIRVPEITELSADEFAALSQSVVWTGNSSDAPQTSSVSQQTPATLASARIQKSQPEMDQQGKANSTSDTTDSKSTNPIDWLKSSWKRITN